MKLSSPRGTRDILPAESGLWHDVHQQIVNILRLYNYHEIKTPMFESAGLFQRAVGDNTDIVEKEMYIFQDKGNRELALRPEGTASVVRAYLEHQKEFQSYKGIKLYYQGPMFRYERPQTGRYRQFYQVGVEAIGYASPLLDTEVMIMARNIFSQIGLKDLEIAVHSVGCDVCRPVIREQLKQFVSSIMPNLCQDCKKRFDHNPLRILDCKNPTCQTYFAGMPEVRNALCHECNDHFGEVLNTLDDNSINYTVDSHLVRGLDYYTKTVFEVRSEMLGAQNAICGGGRYDNLIQELGGRKTPAFGFAIGMDRLIMVIQQMNIQKQAQHQLKYFIIGSGKEAREKAFRLMETLRENHISCDYFYKEGSFSDGLKQALINRAAYAIIIGSDELSSGQYTVKNLVKKKQFSVKTVEELVKLN